MTYAPAGVLTGTGTKAENERVNCDEQNAFAYALRVVAGRHHVGVYGRIVEHGLRQ